MAIHPYLVFEGETREAVQFYADVFGVKDYILTTFGESPQHPDYPIPEEAKHLVMHAMIQLPTAKLMFSDTYPGHPPVSSGNRITLAYVVDDEAHIRQVFERLAEDGKVTMPLQETFWSKCYGGVVDRYGIEWQFSHEA